MYGQSGGMLPGNFRNMDLLKSLERRLFLFILGIA